MLNVIEIHKAKLPEARVRLYGTVRGEDQESYTVVNRDSKWLCQCKSFLFHGDECKHITRMQDEARRLRDTEQAKIASTTPHELTEEFIELLDSNMADVKIRLHYPAHAELATRLLCDRLRIDLPRDIRPIASGSRGGKTLQRSLAGEISYRGADGSIVHRSELGLVLAVLALGYGVSSYARIGK